MTSDKTADSFGHDVEARILLYEARKKDVWMAYVLGAILGFVGGHRFYIGGRSTRYGWLLAALFPVAVVAWLLVAFLPPPLILLPLATLMSLVMLDAGLTYFAVRRRNQELLEEAGIPRELQVQAAPTRLSVAVERLLVLLAGILAVEVLAKLVPFFHFVEYLESLAQP